MWIIWTKKFLQLENTGEFSASQGRFWVLVTVIVGSIIGAFGFRSVVWAAWGALVVRRWFRCSVWPSLRCWGRGARLGFVLRCGAALLALIVWLLWVRLALHSSLLHRTIAARVISPGAFGTPWAFCLTAWTVSPPIWFAVGRNSLSVDGSIFVRVWAALSLLSVGKKKKLISLSSELWNKSRFELKVTLETFTRPQLFSVHPHLKNQRTKWWPWT